MAINDTLLVYKTDATHICTTSEQHIFTLPPLPSDSEKGPTKVLLNISTLIVVTYVPLAVSMCIWKRYKSKSSIMRVCFLLFPVSNRTHENAHSDIFREIASIHNSLIIWVHFASVTVYSRRLQHRKCLNTTAIQIWLLVDVSDI